VKLSDLLEGSSIKFGTSGARGLASELSDEKVFGIVLAFLKFELAQLEELGKSKCSQVAIGGDLRPSTSRIMKAAARAAESIGLEAINCGYIPSPAVADYGFLNEIPSVMVTGSHIPDDRNGIKLVRHCGELLKNEEPHIWEQSLEFGDYEFDEKGAFISSKENTPWVEDDTAKKNYLKRFLSAYPSDALAGYKLGLYEHSAVGRDLLREIYTGLGAEVVSLGRSETFVPVDTEAIREEDHQLAAKWASEMELDAILSTDGDSDRPLVADENGKWFRGDVLGVLVAKGLGAECVVTPVSCNTLVEKCEFFKRVERTKIGSPYVIESMTRSVADGLKTVGYEANGGFLTASDFKGMGQLATRDAVIVHLEILTQAKEKGCPVSGLLSELPQRFTASDRLKEFAPEKSQTFLNKLRLHLEGEGTSSSASLDWLSEAAKVSSVDETDGLRMVLSNDEIVHVRPSGNAPELRCYAEADSELRAQEIVSSTLRHISTLDLSA